MSPACGGWRTERVDAGAPAVLVLRALGLGDLVCGLPALRAVRAAHPGHRVVLAAPAVLAPLAVASGAVDEVLPAGPLEDLPAGMDPPGVAVNLHGRGPQSHRLLQRVRPGRLLAFASPEAGVRGPEWRPGEHEVARWCRMLDGHGVPADPSRLELGVGDDPAHRGAAVVHPGAAAPARRWPPHRFAVIARALRDAGRRVLITGTAGERALAERVAALSGTGPASVLAGATDVLGLARIVSGASVVVSGDTGVAHLAVATGTPTVTLFGPVPPSEWGPPALPRHRVLWAGGRGDPHGAGTDPGLLSIGADRVLRELRALEAVAA
ncbi:MAG: glycosyltransferase family 9 protein [Thermoleophilia bacterium]